MKEHVTLSVEGGAAVGSSALFGESAALRIEELRDALRDANGANSELRNRINALRRVADQMETAIKFWTKGQPIVGEEAIKAFERYKTKYGAW